MVIFDKDATADQLRERLEQSASTLTGFFRYNAEHADGRDLLYQDFPSCFM